MLIGLFGSPSPFSYWTLAALRATVDACSGRYHFIETPSLPQLREFLTERQDENVVYFCDCPEADMARAFLKAGAPYLVCLEPPAEIMGYCVRDRSMRPVDAMRFTTQSLSTLHDLALGPKARVLRRHAERTVSQTVIDFCSTYRLTKDAKLAAESVQRITEGPALQDIDVEELILRHYPNARPIGGYAAELGELGAPDWMLDTVGEYAPLVEARALDQLFWPREAFLDPRGPDEAVLPKQDLFGPARHLVFGPFLHLPAGHWRANVRIQVADVRATALLADVTIMGVPTRVVRFDLPALGMFKFALDFEVKEPRQFVEVRIELARSAIEGQFAFGGVELQRLAAGSGSGKADGGNQPADVTAETGSPV